MASLEICSHFYSFSSTHSRLGSVPFRRTLYESLGNLYKKIHSKGQFKKLAFGILCTLQNDQNRERERLSLQLFTFETADVYDRHNIFSNNDAVAAPICLVSAAQF